MYTPRVSVPGLCEKPAGDINHKALHLKHGAHGGVSVMNMSAAAWQRHSSAVATTSLRATHVRSAKSGTLGQGMPATSQLYLLFRSFLGARYSDS